MIQAPDAAMEPQLIRLWTDAFGDSPEAVRFFLREAPAGMRCRVQTEAGRVLAAAYLLPAQMTVLDRTVPVWYEYALVTDPSQRRRGVMARLLEAVRTEAAEQKVPYTALVPASPALAGYYEKLGYRPFFTVRTVCRTRAQLQTVAAQAAPRPRSAPEADCFNGCASLRAAQLRSAPASLQWDAAHIAFALRFARKTGGCAFSCTAGYAIWSEEQQFAQISEWMPRPGAEPMLTAALLEQSACTAFSFRLPERSPLFGGAPAAEAPATPFGWLRATDQAELPEPAGAYLGLELN